MSSSKLQETKLVAELNNQLERRDVTLASIVRNAARLARFCNEHEYRLLFDLHLSGMFLTKSEVDASAVEKWPDRSIQPKWNPVDAFRYDRDIGDEKVVFASIDEIESQYEFLQKERANPQLQGNYQAINVILIEERKLGQVITRIRNRVAYFVRQIEQELAKEDISSASHQIMDKRSKQPTDVQDTRNVFVVHGRNLEARSSLFRFLRSIGLQPLEWSQAIKATGKASPFIGEILDAAFTKAQAVVVLLTPDDEARLRESFRGLSEPIYETELTGQARPNVLFEAGMAMGRNPDRTIIVELGTLRPFSDIAGRHTVRLSNDSAARHELAQRLETAGCPVDLTGRDWHTEGDFGAGHTRNP